jgi:hypothetical protein
MLFPEIMVEPVRISRNKRIHTLFSGLGAQFLVQCSGTGAAYGHTSDVKMKEYKKTEQTSTMTQKNNVLELFAQRWC